MLSRFLPGLAFALLAFTSCAARESLVVSPQIAPLADPPEGPVLRMDPVADARFFELRPSVSSSPSLLPEDFDKASVKARAIGRARNVYGRAEGEVLLPEGKSVSDLFRAATVRAFRQAGYRVAEAGQPGTDRAPGVSVTIRTYWIWVALSNHYKAACHAEALVKAPFPAFLQGLPVTGDAVQANLVLRPEEERMPGPTADDWADVGTRCLASYSDTLKALLMR